MQAFVVVSLVAVALAACGGPCPNCPVSPGPGSGDGPPTAPQATAAAAAAQQKAAPSVERQRIAVLRIDDDELYRAERVELRKLLASELARRLSNYEIVSLAEVDAKLVPHSKDGGHCAYDAESAERRAAREGWFTTRVMHVLGSRGKPEELWVEVASSERTHEAFEAVWNPKLPRAERYRTVFSSMVPTPEIPGGLGLLDLVGTAGHLDTLTMGALTLCESRGFQRCDPETKGFADRAPALEKCFSGSDEVSSILLFDASGGCELSELDDPGHPNGKREQCLCAALKGSAGVTAKSGRRRLELDFEAPDLKGKVRPELRILETSSNLDVFADWHRVESVKDGKPTPTTVRRLELPNLDDVGAPLARCAMPRGAVVIADLQSSEAGLVTKARLVAGSPSAANAKCIEKALTRVAWPCTEDGKSASLRVALTWPE